MKTELEKKKDVLLNEYRKLIRLSNSKEFFNIPSVNLLESEIAALKQQEVEGVSADLKQYVTNLLYAAYDFAGDVTSTEFDQWVEEQIDNIDEYLNQSSKVTDEMIERYATKQYDCRSWSISEIKIDAFIEGAKAFRGNLIK